MRYINKRFVRFTESTWIFAGTLLLFSAFLSDALLNESAEIIECTSDAGDVSALVIRPQCGTAYENPVICSHGTNSHREVFLPIAWELSLHGATTIMYNSRTVTDSKGEEIRAGEIQNIYETIVSKLNTNISSRIAPLEAAGEAILMGHSDGIPPSWFWFLRKASEAKGELWILGSLLPGPLNHNIKIYAAAGALDQVFSPPNVIESLTDGKTPHQSLEISWLSDHFIEQYDPWLLSAFVQRFRLRDSTSEQNASKSPAGAEVEMFRLESALRIGMRLLWTSILLYASIIWGSFGERAGIVKRMAVLLFIPGFMCQFKPIAGMCLAAVLIGLALGIRACIAMLRFTSSFLGLMWLNLLLSSGYFMLHFTSAIPWLPFSFIWYLLMWPVKIFLFVFSFQSILTGSSAGIFAAFTAILFTVTRPGWAGKILSNRQSQESHTTKIEINNMLPESVNTEVKFSSAQERYAFKAAVVLTILMVGLWLLRARQGLVSAEILTAVVNTYLRLLLLPTWFVLRHIRKILDQYNDA